MTATQRDRINDSILDCRLLIESVHFGMFALHLPSSFTEPPATKEPTELEGAKALAAAAGGAAGGAKKVGGKEGNKKKPNKFIKNESPCPKFKVIEGETWAGTFGNKLVSKCPAWNFKAEMCPRWHIHGHCFKSCINADSHIEASKIPAKKIAKFREFMDALCNLNNSA